VEVLLEVGVLGAGLLGECPARGEPPRTRPSGEGRASEDPTVRPYSDGAPKRTLNALSTSAQRTELRDWLINLDPFKFELEVAALFRSLGYDAQATKATGDGGVDVLAFLENRRYVITVWGLPPSLRSGLTEGLLLGRAGNAAFLSYAHTVGLRFKDSAPH
jgi:hypothetical protein